MVKMAGKDLRSRCMEEGNTKLLSECNRQIYQRIDSHGIIVLERSGTFQHYSCLGGTCSDINRAEAPGTAAGMGSRNSRLQE